MTESDLMALAAKRYPEPEWAFICQVRNGTGYSKTERYADGLALNCYPSRGMALFGFEAKSSRSDWIRELRDPDKSCEIQKYCDRWWIVTAEGVVYKDELPIAWGLLEVSGKKRISLKVIVEAPKLPDPTPLDRGFVASILRNISRAVAGEDLIEKARKAGRAEAIESNKKRIEYERMSSKNESQRLNDRIREFEKASGLMITPWNSGQIGKVVAAVMADGVAVVRNRLMGNLTDIDMARKVIEKALEEMNNDKHENK